MTEHLTGADHRLLEAIRQDPGHTLSHYARTHGISPKLALIAIEQLIARNEVIRHRHSEKLSLPGAQMTPVTVSSQPPRGDIPAFVSRRFRDRCRTELQGAILELLVAGDKSTCELADILHRNSAGLGAALHMLRKRDLVTSEGPIGRKIWHLVSADPKQQSAEAAEISSIEQPELDAIATKPSRTELIRRKLASAGECTSRQLAEVVNVSQAVVFGLLKHDISKGRVERFKGDDGAIRFRLAAPQPESKPVSPAGLQQRIFELERDLQQMTASRDYFESALINLRRDFTEFENAMRPVYAVAQQLDAIWRPLSDSGILTGPEAAYP